MDVSSGRAEGRRKRRLNLEELKEDRISALPDLLLHHILSFLPSTKEAIQTGILSKRWQNQWTRVPVLIFDLTCKSDKKFDPTGNYDDTSLSQMCFGFTTFNPTANSYQNFSQFIDTTLTLHDCPKIKKFHIQYDDKLGCEPHLTSKIRFATRKDVEELILHLYPIPRHQNYILPKFLFTNASLVKLELFNCYLIPHWIINWPRLKELKLECSSLSNSAFGNVISGSPLLESLELTGSIQFPKVVIVLKCLKRLIFVDVECESGRERIDIVCPNLEELSFSISGHSKFTSTKLPIQTIENVLSGSPLLHKLELRHCLCSERLVIASNSLKKLVLGRIDGTLDYEISCPNLEEVNLYHFMPSEFGSINDIESKPRHLVMKILRQLQHVNLLGIGSWFIQVLSALELEGLVAPLLNCKILTIDGINFDENFPGIVYAIRSSPALEKLVIKLHGFQLRDLPNLNDSRKNYWTSNEGADFKFSMSNLKNVEIIGFSDRDAKRKFLLNFLEFLLKNARMLDRIVVILAGCGASVPFEVSKRLISFQRCFPRTTIELLSSS